MLLRNLKAEAIAPEDIDTVILTHGHPDHIGGNTDHEGKPAFPMARYVLWCPTSAGCSGLPTHCCGCGIRTVLAPNRTKENDRTKAGFILGSAFFV